MNYKEARNEEDHTDKVVLIPTVLVIPYHYTHPRTHVEKTESRSEACDVKKEKRLWVRGLSSRG